MELSDEERLDALSSFAAEVLGTEPAKEPAKTVSHSSVMKWREGRRMDRLEAEGGWAEAVGQLRASLDWGDRAGLVDAQAAVLRLALDINAKLAEGSA